MRNLLHRISQYLFYFLKATNQYSLQSPFLYTLYQSAVRRQKPTESFARIEEQRRHYLRSQQQVTVHDYGAGGGQAHHTYTVRQRRVAHMAKSSLSSQHVSVLLHRLVNHFSCTHVVELGTSLGINTLYLAGGQQRRVATFEGCPNTAALAKGTFNRFGFGHIQTMVGPIDDQLPGYLAKSPPVDFAFIDANHRYAPTMRYFQWLVNASLPQTVIVFDDIHWSPGMTKAWKAACRHPKVTLSLDLYRVGVVLLNPELPQQHHVLAF